MTIAQYFEPTAEDRDDLHVKVIQAFEEVSLLTVDESVPLDAVLRLVGRRLCELLGVTRCSVYLRRDDGRFQGQVGYSRTRGNIDAKVSKLVAGVEHDLFTAEIVATTSPVAIQDAVHDPRTIQRTMRAWGVRDMLGVPLVVDHEVIGVIYVDNEEERHSYSDRDIEIAQAFAGLSALAVKQCWLLRRLAEKAEVIDRQRRMLAVTSAVHNRVTRAVTEGAGLDEILQTVVELLGKPVVLYTPDFKVISWSGPESAGDRHPGMDPSMFSRPWVRAALRELGAGAPSILLRAQPETRCRRILSRLVSDGRCLGYLELAELSGRFSDVDQKSLEQAAMAISLKMLTLQRESELQRRLREEFVADLFHGRRTPEWLEKRARSFDFNLSARHFIVRLHYAEDTPADSPTGERRRQLLSAALTAGLPDGYHCLASTRVPAADLFILEAPVSEAGHADGPLQTSLTGWVEKFRAQVGIAYVLLSDPCTALQKVHQAAERLREIDELLAQQELVETRLYSSRELDLVRLIGRREGIDAVIRYAKDQVQPLIDHDGANGELVKTLHEYIRCQGRVRATAIALSVHENTVRYRLSRIKALSPIDPERMDSLLLMMLAVQLEDLFAVAR